MGPRWALGGLQVGPRWAPGGPQVGFRWAPGGLQAGHWISVSRFHSVSKLCPGSVYVQYMSYVCPMTSAVFIC